VPFRHCGSEGEEPAGRASGTGTGPSPKVKEFVYIAIDCATTHLYVLGLKLRIRNAERLGATPEEVMEVFELASLMGV
jgi:alkylhydroperoxidase/carboxymuconolactone decarboxylase family protein YurZ